MKILIAAGLLILVPAVAFIGCGVSYYNREVDLRASHEANEDANKIVYNKFVKIISEKAGVVKASVEAQKELFAIVMNSKQGTSGTLMNFIHQHNPNPDTALSETSQQFRDILVSIEGLREEFARVQKKSRDIEREHDTLLRGFWSSKMVSLFGGNTEELETNIVVGPETDDAFSGKGDSGVDTNKLFN